MPNSFFARHPFTRTTLPFPASDSGLIRHYVKIHVPETEAAVTLSYVKGGAGAPIILLHGLGATAAAWRRTLPVLMQQYTVYAIDLLGCGESDKPEGEYTIQAMADTIKQFMDEVGLTHAHIIGHSFGGGVTMQLCTTHPEMIDRVILVSSGGLGKAVHWLLRASTLPGAHRVIAALTSPRSPLPNASRVIEQQRMRRLNVEFDDVGSTIFERLQSPATRQAFIHMISSSSGLQGQKISALPLLSQLDKDVLIIWGRDDNTIPVAHGYAGATLIPRAHIEVIDNCFHRPQIEAPDTFNALVIHFLQAQQWPPEVDEEVPELHLYNVSRQRQISRFAAPAALVLVGTTVLLNARSRRRRR